MPLSKEAYKFELQRQADEVQQRREQAKREEALMDKKQVEANEIRHRMEL